jgi:hypothetical protein
MIVMSEGDVKIMMSSASTIGIVESCVAYAKAIMLPYYGDKSP